MDELDAIRNFVDVVSAGSFTAAARQNGTRQSTVSKKIAALEEHLGTRLLDRGRGQTVLTEAGQSFYDRSLGLLQLLDEAEAEVRSHSRSARGTLRISVPAVLARMVITPLLCEFLEAHPMIRIELQQTDRHVDLVAEGVDVAIRARQFEDRTLTSRTLSSNPMFVVASSRYLAIRGEPAHPDDLRRHQCIIYSRRSSDRLWLFADGKKQLRVEVGGRITCDDGEDVMVALLAHQGIAVLPYWMIAAHVEQGRLRRILGSFTPISLPISIVFPKARHVPLKVRVLVDFLESTIKERCLLPDWPTSQRPDPANRVVSSLAARSRQSDQERKE